MNELQRIADQLHRAFYGEAWHGPWVLDVLKDVSAAQAAAKPLPDAHSIWEITLHIAAWEDAGRRRLLGEHAQLSELEDWPPVGDTSETAWREAIKQLIDRHEALEQTVAGFDESRLNEPSPGQKTNYYLLLHGLIQHELYHAGQIAVLKKAPHRHASRP